LAADDLPGTTKCSIFVTSRWHHAGFSCGGSKVGLKGRHHARHSRSLALRPVQLSVTPGPDTAYIIGRSIQLGWRGGAAAAIGICCGCLFHVFGAAIGLSALLRASLRHLRP
jgi:hypothetical protein